MNDLEREAAGPGSDGGEAKKDSHDQPASAWSHTWRTAPVNSMALRV